MTPPPLEMSLSKIEQIKHRASAVNSFAVAIAASGSLSPIFALVTDRLSDRIPLEALFCLAGLCLIAAYLFHETGRLLLEQIR